MKKILSFCLVFALCLCLFSCGSDGNPVEKMLSAVKSHDVAALREVLTSDCEAELASIEGYLSLLEPSELETIKALYGLMHYTVKAHENGAVSVSGKMPDVERVISLAEKKLLVTAQTAEELISEMLESGEIEANMMLELSEKLVLTDVDGVLRISCAEAENADFWQTVGYSRVLAFFAKN